MLSAVNKALLGLLGSKKFIAAALGVLALVLQAVLGALGVDVGDEKVLSVLAMIATYVLGQGVADLGKAKAEADAAKPVAAKPSSPPKRIG